MRSLRRAVLFLGLAGSLAACATGRAGEPPAGEPAAAEPAAPATTEPATTVPATTVPATTEPAMTETAVIETIDETTVGDLDGVRVPMGNMTTGTYTLPDGTEQRGTICSLALPGGPGVFVGLGSRVDVEGTTWEVVGIEKPPGQLGSVTLKMLAD